MDKLARYQKLLKEAFTEYAPLLQAPPEPPYEVALAFDDEHGQYVLREIGWTKDGWVRNTVLHVSLHDNKIWIQEDSTEDGVARWLLQKGVPSEDIVLAFQPPESRNVTALMIA